MFFLGGSGGGGVVGGAVVLSYGSRHMNKHHNCDNPSYKVARRSCSYFMPLQARLLYFTLNCQPIHAPGPGAYDPSTAVPPVLGVSWGLGSRVWS